MSDILGNLPQGAQLITKDAGDKLVVPNTPAVGFIEGDGIGPDIWKATRTVLDAAVQKAYGDGKKIAWVELLAGEKAYDQTGEYLPQSTIDGIADLKVAIKGPLTTPVGGGFRSLNVTLRQVLDLYACIRPVRYIPGVPSPVKRPEAVDMVIYRENTEDVYAGIEWASGTAEAKRVIEFLVDQMGVKLDPDSGIGIKPMSPKGTKRLVAMAMDYAIALSRKSVTLVHKGNIMKFTEGAFRDWGYELAAEKYADTFAKEGDEAPGKLVIKDRIADAMFQQVLLRPDEYDVLAMPNLNGDYLSDALAAQVGGLGMAPGANVGDIAALFEATHGTAPKYAGLDKVNPGSLILSGVMMLEHMGWLEAAKLIPGAMSKAVQDGQVTYDLARQISGASELSCSGFAAAVAERL